MIPMHGSGTRADPWRPKYLREAGVTYSIRNARAWCLADVDGDAKVVDEIAAQPDVIELRPDSRATPAAKRAAIRALCQSVGITLTKDATEAELVESLESGIRARQMSETPADRIAMRERLIRGA